jgi:predicted RNA-binding Zn-ribbon protein involved in translation (DUF1610 family)
MESNGVVHCPRCGAVMVYLVEKEKNGKGEARITRYFRCPVCGTKVVDEIVLVKPQNGSIQVYTLPIAKRVIYAGRRGSKNGRSRKGSGRNSR